MVEGGRVCPHNSTNGKAESFQFRSSACAVLHHGKEGHMENMESSTKISQWSVVNPTLQPTGSDRCLGVLKVLLQTKIKESQRTNLEWSVIKLT